MINENYQKKLEKLEELKVFLKHEFVGLDNIIDEIVNNIQIWYVMPELQSRPMIISLWGTTGVGKTDLVRKLVKFLEFNDKFIEIQLDMKEEHVKKIQDVIENTNVDSKEPCILLLDEMQRFRTIDEEGNMIRDNEYFNDIWMLLSDGKFQSNSSNRREIFSLIMEELYDKEYTLWHKNNDPIPKKRKRKSKALNSNDIEKIEDSEVPKEKPQFKYQTYYYKAKQFKRLLKSNLTIEEIMQLSPDERLDLLQRSFDKNETYEGDNYQKMLIFISGNLDEAFSMSGEVEDVEMDADIYHEFSKKINIVEIKKSLMKQFKPEQISRFGNTHIIYPTLSKSSYQTIIKNHCFEISKRVKENTKIDISFTDAIYDLIYKNGVFPTQGVRPVLSTISQILENNLPYFLFYSMKDDLQSIVIDHEYDKLICGDLKRTIKLDIESIKKKKSIDEKILVAVHELGHSIVYSVLYKCAPTQININSTRITNNGFTAFHDRVSNKIYMKNDICICLAGQILEETIFGDNYRSAGSIQDLAQATEYASSFIRRLGMDGNLSRITTKTPNDAGAWNYDIDSTNKLIEVMLQEQKERAKDIINNHLKLIKQLIKWCKENNKIEIEDYIRICKEHSLELNKVAIENKLIHCYDEQLNEFLK